MNVPFWGALYADGTTGTDKLDDWVQPGQTYTYKWYLTKSFAPTKDDDNCLPLGYHPHVRSPKDIDSGLVGMMTVCKPGIHVHNICRSFADTDNISCLLNMLYYWRRIVSLLT